MPVPGVNGLRSLDLAIGRVKSVADSPAIDAVLQPEDAAHMRPAQADRGLDNVSSTGLRSKVERLMTLSTSLVAVWYSSDSCNSAVRWRVSVSSRAFSIAMTACAAKFSRSAICLSENGRTSLL